MKFSTKKIRSAFVLACSMLAISACSGNQDVSDPIEDGGSDESASVDENSAGESSDVAQNEPATTDDATVADSATETTAEPTDELAPADTAEEQADVAEPSENPDTSGEALANIIQNANAPTATEPAATPDVLTAPPVPVETAAADAATIEEPPAPVVPPPTTEPIVQSTLAPVASNTIAVNHDYYFVVPGDTLGAIAHRLYGNAAQWRQLAALNDLDNPNLIHPGDRIAYEKTAETAKFAQAYTKSNRKEVKVQPGETLSMIAKRVLGNSSQWKALWRANEKTIPDPDVVAAGITLYYFDGDKTSH